MLAPRFVIALLAAGASCHRAAPSAEPAAEASRKGGSGGGREQGNGMRRFMDTTVYLDGAPVGVLSGGELPVGLAPIWIEDKVSAPKRYGDGSPGWKLVRQRRYRFDDYLRAVGVELAKVKEIHVYGPKSSEVLVASGEELSGPAASGFMFRFGDEVSGKPIPVVPPDFGNGRAPDKITAVAIYAERTPPTLVRNVGMTVDGAVVDGIPYATGGARGGARIYVDDKLVALIKRRLIDESTLEIEDGRANLLAFLRTRGVDTDKLVDAWVVRDGRRVERLGARARAEASFEVGAHTNARLRAGDGPDAPDAITFHTRELSPEALAQLSTADDAG